MTNSPSTLPRALRVVFLATGAFIATAAFRWWGIHAESLWYDEVLVTRNLDATSLSEFLRRIRFDNPPVSPFYFVLVYYWSKIGLGTVIGLRGLSVLIASCTGVLLFRLGARYFSITTGLVAAWLHAVAIDQVYYGQEIRMYALTVLLGMISVAVLLRLLHLREAEGDTAWVWIGVAAGVNSLMLQTHLLSAFLLVAEGLALLAILRTRPRLVIAFIVVHLVAVAPALIWLANLQPDHIDNGTRWIQEMNTPHVAEVLVWLPTWLADQLATQRVRAILPVFLSLVLGAAVILRIRRASEAEARTILALALCAAVPVILLALLSLLRPMFIPRYVLFAAAPFFLLLPGLAAGIPRAALRHGLLAALVLMSFSGWATSPRPYREDWISAARYLQARADAGDLVIVIAGISGEAVARYLPQDPKHGVIHARSLASVPRIVDAFQRDDHAILLAGSAAEFRALQASLTPEHAAILPPETFARFNAHFPARISRLCVYQVP